MKPTADFAPTHSTARAAVLLVAAMTSSGPVPAADDVGAGPVALAGIEDQRVVRSVLDGRTRIVSLRLSDSVWAAWDTRSAGLYKVWRGGVDWRGPVFDTQHGPQPSAAGAAWIRDDGGMPWRLTVGGRVVPLEVRYRGHRYAATASPRQASLLYSLSGAHEGETIDIAVTETPALSLDDGTLGFERTFGTEGVPPRAELRLRFDLDALSAEDAIETDGALIDVARTRSGDGAWAMLGVLVVNSNATTRLTARLADEPRIPMEPVEADDRGPPGAALIADSDCVVCHNPEAQTVGPSWRAIAAEYGDDEATVSRLATRVIEGGGGVWGNAVMTPHPQVSAEDAALMVRYILASDDDVAERDGGTDGVSLAGRAPGTGDNSGIAANFYTKAAGAAKLADAKDPDAPIAARILPAIHAVTDANFGSLTNNFYLEASGFITIDEPGDYVLRLVSDDGSILEVDGETVIDNDGSHGDEARDAVLPLDAGRHPFLLRYFQGTGGKSLSLQWRPPGAGGFTYIPPEVFTHDPDAALDPRLIEAAKREPVPGFGTAVEGVHPSFDLETIRPEAFEPMVGGLDVFDDGRVAVSTWDAEGSVWIVSNTDAADREDIAVKRIAHGLAEPLGLVIVDGEILVMQKQELTRLVDLDGDEITDYYETVSNDWTVTDNFHEFAFGLVEKDGDLYATLATAILPGGASAENQASSRGKAIRISPGDGDVEFVAHGLRTPNGIGAGIDGEIFVTDNQGDWLPASKIVHLQRGAFYGSRSVDFEGTAGLRVTPPVAWLPQDEIGNSPSQPAILDIGPYEKQMIHGEVTHGGIKRVFVEKVDGEYQGAVFRFTQGLEAGVNRIAWGPDRRLYVGGVGNPGNWGHMGRNWYGLQRLTYNGNATFEMLAVRAKSNGIEIEFTEPLEPGAGHDPASYEIRQWRYVPTAEYGGPKVDDTRLPIRSVAVSDDRRRVFLALDGLREDHVVYVNLLEHFVSANGNELWSGEAWYTLNAIPADDPGPVGDVPYVAPPPNTLTAAERAAGWRLLFDGDSLDGWHGYRSGGVPERWTVVDGTLAVDTGAAGRVDLVSDRRYRDFELRLDWKVAAGGNSGIFFNVVEDAGHAETWHTGPEIQILDNRRHADSVDRHRAGDLYDLVSSRLETSRPAGEWNESRIIVEDGRLQHWLNGVRVIDERLWSERWRALVASSKFADMPAFGKARRGRIALQDHGDAVWFRNIRLRER